MTLRRSLLTALSALLLTATGATALAPAFEEGLRSSATIYVATRRSDGTRSTAAPIWFWWNGENLYFTTSPDSHKARRIRRGSPVYVSVSGEDGPYVEGATEILNDLDLVARMGEEYNAKYWIAWFGFFRPRPDRVQEGKTVAVKVTFPAVPPTP